MSRLPLIVALSLFAASPVAATQFWLSPHFNAAGSTPPANAAALPKFYSFISQPAATIYIWVKPDSGDTLENWSLRLRSMTTSVLDFSSSDVYNPVLLDAVKDHVRWEIVIDPNSNSDLSGDLMGFTVTNDLVEGKGIGPTTTGQDPYYFGSDAWLLGKINFTPQTIGTTDIFLQIGLLGLNNVGEYSEDTPVVFGHDAAFLDASTTNRHVNGGTRDATVQVFATPDADFNNDLVASGLDFLIWQRNSGTVSGLNSNGNATYGAGDMAINRVDLAAWAFQYGSAVPFGGSLAAVPEPTTFGLSLAAILAMLTSVHRRGAS